MFFSAATFNEERNAISRSVALTVSKPSFISNRKFSNIGIGVRDGTAGIILANSFSKTLLFILNSI
jgi:hypothetical protein